MISRVTIGVDACSARAPIYEAICGTNAHEFDTCCLLSFSGSTIELSENAAPGVQGVAVGVEDLERARHRLARSTVKHVVAAEEISIERSEACGLTLRLNRSRIATSASTSRIDHIALRVFDLERSTRQWETMLGATATKLGVHPISNGAFEATRIALGSQMIELIGPVPGVDSVISQRLASHGEGVAALAIPSVDVEGTRRRLEELGVKPLWRDPHWLVHPKDTSGVLVQLTPRVGH